MEEIVARWHIHLASKHPRKAWTAVGVVVAATLLALWATRSLLMTLVCGVALFSAVADFLLPMTFTLTRRAAMMRGWFKAQRIEWQDVRAIHEDESGVKLSPFAHRSRLEPYRGVYLWFNGNREQVMAWVRTLATKVESS